jgi:hypothetical protein
MLQPNVYRFPGLSGGIGVRRAQRVHESTNTVTVRHTFASTRCRATFLHRYCGLRPRLFRRQLHYRYAQSCVSPILSLDHQPHQPCGSWDRNSVPVICSALHTFMPIHRFSTAVSSRTNLLVCKITRPDGGAQTQTQSTPGVSMCWVATHMRQPFGKPMYVYSFANLRLCGGGELVRVMDAHRRHGTGCGWENGRCRTFYSRLNIFNADSPGSSVKKIIPLISR